MDPHSLAAPGMPYYYPQQVLTAPMVFNPPVAHMPQPYSFMNLSPAPQGPPTSIIGGSLPQLAEARGPSAPIPPCQHNNWDNLRAKNSVVTLCCRDCQQKWKLQFPIRAMCVEFHQRMVCAFGVSCPFLHVHRFKSVQKSPNPPNHVVGAVKDTLFEQCACEILSRYPAMTPPSAVLHEVQDLYEKKKDNLSQVSSNGPPTTPQYQPLMMPSPGMVNWVMVPQQPQQPAPGGYYIIQQPPPQGGGQPMFFSQWGQ